MFKGQIFLEYLETWKTNLCWEKQTEILRKIKKDISHSEDNQREKNDDHYRLGGDIVDMKIADDGSILTYIKDRKEPIRSYADWMTVNTISALKHIIPLLISNLIQFGWIKRIITLLALIYNRDIFSQYLFRFYQMFPILLKDEHWSQPVKEIRRVLKGYLKEEEIDFISLIIEYDSAYKNRLQDILPLLNKSELKGFRAIKEIKRLFDIISVRDYEQMADKWRKMGKLICLAMLIPKIRKNIIAILKELNLDEIKFSKEDLYWVNQFPSYNYLGISLKERNKNNIEKYGSIK